jgi:uncharacterized protein GlcG (DUF336 family)
MKREAASTIAIASLLLASCGGGGGSNAGPAPGPVPPAATRLFADPAQVALTTADVQQIIAQAVAEAQARARPATIVVVDRVGNVLAAFQMNGANTNLSVPASPSGVNHDLQGVNVAGGAVAGAIAKAITGAYLSSAGNAFSSRTASQIVQEHFPPSAAARGLESGPLFGVQFSQLPCSDLSSRFAPGGAAPFIGPKRSPLGLSADPGGFPLYKNGVVVGGVGVMADGVYGFDPEITDVDADDEEAIALAATQNFAAAAEIQANRITVDGTSLRYSDALVSDLRGGATQPFVSLVPGVGNLIAVNGYTAAAITPGTAYGTEASGIRLATAAEFNNPDAYILTNGAGANRYPATAGATPAGTALTQAEVRALLEEAFKIMAAARAQIRQPLDSRAQVTISVVDTSGNILGVVRGPDAPIFGTDVSLQKARTAAFFSSATAGAELLANTAPSPDVRNYVGLARIFFNDPSALTGQFAFTDRANGNISRPYFPDGELGRPPGAFSRPIAEFNPFSTGLQSALILDNVLQHVGFILGANPDTPQQCTLNPNPGRLANGIQIFPGSVPVYRGNTLVGGVGVSGDGIDQDDMISFLGTHNGGLRVGTIGNAPTAIRADNIVVPVAGAANGGVRLRYVNCPFNPFIGTNEQYVCQGK